MVWTALSPQVLQAVAADPELARMAGEVIDSTTVAAIPTQFHDDADQTTLERRRARMPHLPSLNDPTTLLHLQPVEQENQCPLPVPQQQAVNGADSVEPSEDAGLLPPVSQQQAVSGADSMEPREDAGLPPPVSQQQAVSGAESVEPSEDADEKTDVLRRRALTDLDNLAFRVAAQFNMHWKHCATCQKGKSGCVRCRMAQPVMIRNEFTGSVQVRFFVDLVLGLNMERFLFTLLKC